MMTQVLDIALVVAAIVAVVGIAVLALIALDRLGERRSRRRIAPEPEDAAAALARLRRPEVAAVEGFLGGAIPGAWVQFLESLPEELAGEIACPVDGEEDPEAGVLVPLDVDGVREASLEHLEPGSRRLPIVRTSGDDVLIVRLTDSADEDPPVRLEWHEDPGAPWPVAASLSAMLARIRPLEDH